MYKPLCLFLLLMFFGSQKLVAQEAIGLGRGYKSIVLDTSYHHLRWGVYPSDHIFRFAAYVSSFDGCDDDNGDGRTDLWAIPEWVAFEIKAKKSNEKPKYKRPNWMTVDSLYTQGIAPNDASYHVKGTRNLKVVKSNYRFVRGHLCPKETADRLGKAAGWNTHTFLNALPQLQWQNNGCWKALESKCLDWADAYEQIWVITGPVFFNKSPALWLGQGDEVPVAVPDALFKIVLRTLDNGRVKTLCFLIPNIVPVDKKYSEFVCSIDAVEAATGLDFLTNISIEEQAHVESLGENIDPDERMEMVLLW